MKIKVFLLVVVFCYAGSLFAQKVTHVNHVTITVSDMEESIAFLQGTVNAKLMAKFEINSPEVASLFGISEKQLPIKSADLTIGDEKIRLLQFNESQNRKVPHDSRSNDLWFQHIAIVVSDMDEAYTEVKQDKVEHVSTFPQVLPDYIPAAAGISAFYFRDKDDHNLELIYFPKEKGNPKWQSETSELFLGIDHTAIAVSDTDESLDFYQNLLGLKLAGNSENYGPEQEHLNQVFGARLLITGLHAEKGFGVEFLQYIAPPGGRLYPEDSSPLDLWHWHTAMQVDDLEALLERVKQRNTPQISTEIQQVLELNMSKAILIRDPDGHAILLYEEE